MSTTATMRELATIARGGIDPGEVSLGVNASTVRKALEEWAASARRAVQGAAPDVAEVAEATEDAEVDLVELERERERERVRKALAHDRARSQRLRTALGQVADRLARFPAAPTRSSWDDASDLTEWVASVAEALHGAGQAVKLLTAVPGGTPELRAATDEAVSYLTTAAYAVSTAQRTSTSQAALLAPALLNGGTDAVESVVLSVPGSLPLSAPVAAGDEA